MAKFTRAQKLALGDFYKAKGSISPAAYDIRSDIVRRLAQGGFIEPDGYRYRITNKGIDAVVSPLSAYRDDASSQRQGK